MDSLFCWNFGDVYNLITHSSFLFNSIDRERRGLNFFLLFAKYREYKTYPGHFLAAAKGICTGNFI